MTREDLIASAKRALSDYDIATARRVSVAPDRLATLLAEMVALAESDRTADIGTAAPAGEEHPAAKTTIEVPVPHVPFGPDGVPTMLADADYLDHAPRNIAAGYAVGGFNVTSTAVKLLHDTATALRATHQPNEQEQER